MKLNKGRIGNKSRGYNFKELQKINFKHKFKLIDCYLQLTEYYF